MPKRKTAARAEEISERAVKNALQNSVVILVAMFGSDGLSLAWGWKDSCSARQVFNLSLDCD